MTPSECLTLLELEGSATADQIKRAYRRQAQRIHPDKHGGDDAARRRFIRVSRAYRALMRAARAAESGARVGTCARCREFREVQLGLDGHLRCPDCALRTGHAGRLLPLPVIVIAKCLPTIVLDGVAIYLAVLAWWGGRPVHAAWAVGAGWLGLAALAITCLTVVHCTDARQQALERAIKRAGARGEPAGRPRKRAI